jgi:hypothetical protein
MKQIHYFFILVIVMSMTENVLSQENYFLDQPDSAGLGGSAFIGAVTADGQNYQQIGVRADIPIGKLGLGLDFQLLFDEKGHIRKEDWDEWHDYLDKLYYVRWGYKGDPFYIKAGGLDYTYIGYRNLVNGYTNMLEYPTIKRWGMEMSFERDKLGGEIFLNDFKEIFEDKGSFVYGTRITYKLIGDLTIGGSIAGDLNEYNGLKDLDDDGFPDEIDQYPNNKKWVTEYDKFYTQSDGDTEYINKSIEYGILTDTTRRESLFNKKKERSTSFLYSVDLGYPILKGERFSLDIYTQFSKINNYGWGVTFPGAYMGIGNFLYITAEYRRQSEEFLYGYFDNTYELERAKFVSRDDSLVVVTRQESLKEINQDLNGFFAGAQLNLTKFIGAGIYYQDMIGDTLHRRSIRGEVALRQNIIPNLYQAKAYYIQNNVQDFREWKTPSTIMGYIIEYNLKGATLGFEYRYTFQDVNGDGKIRGSNETTKTFGFRTSVRF